MWEIIKKKFNEEVAKMNITTTTNPAEPTQQLM